MKKLSYLSVYTIVFYIFFNTINFCQTKIDNLSSIKYYGNNLIFADNNNCSIYLYNSNNAIKIIEGRGVGLYYSLNEKNEVIGYKAIEENGLQTPYIYKLRDNKSLQLTEPVAKCGQVFINNLGTVCFTTENFINLIFIDGTKKSYNLGYYSNITKISNNNKLIVYNDHNDQIWILNTITGEKFQISDNIKGYFNPSFSNSDNYLSYQALNGEIFIYNFNSKTTKNIGIGFSPSWANNSDRILFYTKIIEGEKVINTDIEEYDCYFDVKNKLTESNNIFEIDPSYNINDTKIAYCFLNKENICVADYNNNKLNNSTETQIKINYLGKICHIVIHQI
ncbi:MAG TPA: hypothetical protein PL041_08810 [Melioribacteraceae bacterium]|nr:hypothetical protein [Melioribacteraceae bacterium]